ncbi:hypothetical protein imdm_594 [gamma proteobacterium IMCC2047]|nr:hypothetical protein imdm_594 [gamma proteobacterium IMCC2047]
MLEKHLFNEAIIPVDLQSRLRKVLALIGDPDYDLTDYGSIVKGMFLEADYGDLTKESAKKKLERLFERLVYAKALYIFGLKMKAT